MWAQRVCENPPIGLGCSPRAQGYGPSGCCVACCFLARWHKMTRERYLSDNLKPRQQTEDVILLEATFHCTPLFSWIVVDLILLIMVVSLLSDHHFKSVFYVLIYG